MFFEEIFSSHRFLPCNLDTVILKTKQGKVEGLLYILNSDKFVPRMLLNYGQDIELCQGQCQLV